jgi:uncharacterized lipoprotein NlpE involved in copper resistance
MHERLLALFLITTLAGCGPGGDAVSSAGRAAEDASAAAPAETAAVDTHTSRTSLDWMGTYTGVLPCADCAGIETRVTLHEDGTFTRSRTYLGRDDRARMDDGEFAWDDAGQTITLTAGDGSMARYQVGENVLVHLDREGRPITGALADQYRLAKNHADPQIEDQRWVLIELRGEAVETTADGRVAFLILDSAKAMVNGNDSCNAFFGTYTLAPGNRIDFGKNMGSTMMACPESAAATALPQVLLEVDNYAVRDGVLSLNKARMAPLARFRVAPDTQ